MHSITYTMILILQDLLYNTYTIYMYTTVSITLILQYTILTYIYYILYILYYIQYYIYTYTTIYDSRFIL